MTMPRTIPPIVAKLAAALDAHEWRLARVYADDKSRPDVHAALKAIAEVREELLTETARVNDMDDAVDNLKWLSTRHGRQGRQWTNATAMHSRRVAAYLRWCVRRLRLSLVPRASSVLSHPPIEGEMLGEYRARIGSSGSDTHAARTIAWHNGHWESVRAPRT